MVKTPRRDMKMLIGDINAKMRTDNAGKDLITCGYLKHCLGVINDNIGNCVFNDLVLRGCLTTQIYLQRDLGHSSPKNGNAASVT
jgi:hypothetical protein